MSAMEDRNQKQTARSCGADASACSPKPPLSMDTPETREVILSVMENGACIHRLAAKLTLKSEELERERDEARLLCRWAFPRLRAMCHDFDATGTGWCCAEEMDSHPEIFPENAKSPSTGATE
jgi:hypothetical protein